MAEKPDPTSDRWIRALKNNPTVATIVVIGVIVIGIGGVAEAIKHVEEIIPSSREKVANTEIGKSPEVQSPGAHAGPGTDKQLQGFLAAKELAVPGTTYTDGELMRDFDVKPMSTPINVSSPILSGSFRGLSSESSSAVGAYGRFLLQKDGVVVGAMITQTCKSNAAIMCNNNYTEWKSYLEKIEGPMQDSVRTLAGFTSATASGTEGGKLSESTAYDGQWRIYISRLDPPDSTASNIITLLIARDPY
jgi:hypothetical protein